MSEVLIKKLSDGDAKSLKHLLDSQRELHGFYSVKALSCDAAIEKVWRLDKAKDALSRNRLYRVLSTEFACVHVERNWEGCDVSVRLRVRIYPEGDGFARWLLYNRDSWDADDTVILASALEAVLQTDAQYGLAAYVRACLRKLKLERLRDVGVDAWPLQGVEFLRAKWLGVVDVEELRVNKHETVKRPIAICEGAILNEQYRLIRKLGQGGMGEVWLSEDIYWEKDGEEKEKFAIKVLLPTVDRNVRERIKHEASIQKRLRHDNIACIRNCHIDEGNSFLVIDYIAGHTLSDYLEKHGGHLSPEAAKKLLLPIARAVDFAHEKGIVHRDIKPDNIMIEAGDDGEETPYILDFGLARRSSVSRRVSVCGTEPYMPPELLLEDEDVINSTEALCKIDVYSFAATMYQCLTGNFPFASRKEILDVNKCPKPLSSTVPYGTSIMRGLSKDPGSRPKKCVELLNPPPDIPQVSLNNNLPKKPSKAVAEKPSLSVSHAEQVVLPLDVIDKYRYMLGQCELLEICRRIQTLGDDFLDDDERVGWCVRDVDAFKECVESVPHYPVEEMMSRRAEHLRVAIRDWFGNHRIDKEFNAATAEVLSVIFNSITRVEDRRRRK